MSYKPLGEIMVTMKKAPKRYADYCLSPRGKLQLDSAGILSCEKHLTRSYYLGDPGSTSIGTE